MDAAEPLAPAPASLAADLNGTRAEAEKLRRQVEAAAAQPRPHGSIAAIAYRTACRVIPKSMSSTMIGDGHRFSDKIMRQMK